MPFRAKYSPVLIVDIGNTNIVCAVFVNGEAQAMHRFVTNALRSVEDYHQEFLAAVPGYCEFTFVAIGSVVPQVGHTIQAMFARYSTAKVFEVNGLSALGLGYITPNPALVGADLVANALAAWKLYKGSALVVDLGTATTIQLITEFGLYAGVIIAPGLKTAAANLFEKAALLSEIELAAPPSLLSNNTQDALLTGIVRGHALMIKAFIESIKSDQPQYAPYQVILSGGLAAMLKNLLPEEWIVDTQLTLKGLYLALVQLAEQEQFSI
jgi:type III pantothenate kinase